MPESKRHKKTNMENNYSESERIFKESDLKKEITGFVNWQIELPNCKLECWTHIYHGAIIIQIWPNGNGFTPYKSFKNSYKSDFNNE